MTPLNFDHDNKFMWFLLHIAALSMKKKIFFLSDSNRNLQLCVGTSVSKHCFLFRASSWILEDANTHLISLSTSCPYPLTIQIYEEKKNPDQTSFCQMEKQLPKLLFCPNSFFVPHIFGRREFWASEQGSEGRAFPSTAAGRCQLSQFYFCDVVT